MNGRLRHAENASDFARRQYAQLIQTGVEPDAAKTRLSQVLGEHAADALDGEIPVTGSNQADAIARWARELGGDGLAAGATFAAARRDMHVFALDWWRPARSFLLYALVLLLMAIGLVAFFMIKVLPTFAYMDQLTGVGHGGAAGRLMALGGIRLWLPLLCVAVLLTLFAAALLAIRRAMSDLRPLPGMAVRAGQRNRGAHGYALVRGLEQLCALHHGGVPASRMPEALGQIWAHPPRNDAADASTGVDQSLRHAAELGTFAAELDWQLRIARSHMQTRWELARDRFILAARIAFYLIIGYLIAALYMPIFTLASHVGPHL